MWLALLAAAPLYLTYRTYKVYLGRIDDERVTSKRWPTCTSRRSKRWRSPSMRRTRPRRRTSVASRSTPPASPRAGHVGQRDPGRQDRGAAARHRQARRARAHPLEAGSADAGRVPEDPRAPAGRRRNHQRRAVPVSGGAAHPQPPRAMGRQGLSAGIEGRRDSARRAHPVGRRLLRRADVGSPVPQGDDARCGARAAAAGSGPRARSGGRADVHQAWPQTMEAAAARRESATHATAVARADERARHGRRSGSSPRATKGNTVFEDIALAHREIYALYEIAQTMGTSLGVADTMALIASKLSNLVPFSACALFLFDEDATRCAAASPPASKPTSIGTMMVRAGQGLAGWVARNRRPLVNARPSAEFEAAGLSPSRRRCNRRWSRRWSSAIASSARSPSTRRRPTSTPTITAACSIASANRPPP